MQRSLAGPDKSPAGGIPTGEGMAQGHSRRRHRTGPGAGGGIPPPSGGSERETISSARGCAPGYRHTIGGEMGLPPNSNSPSPKPAQGRGNPADDRDGLEQGGASADKSIPPGTKEGAR